MDREVAQKVEQALKETIHLTKGRSRTSWSRRLQQALAKAEVELKQIESSSTSHNQLKLTTINRTTPK